MTAAPARYTRRPTPVEAIRLTPDTLTDAANWCGGWVTRKGTDVRLHLAAAPGARPLTARVDLLGSDYLVRDVATGRFTVWAAPDFHAAYVITPDTVTARVQDAFNRLPASTRSADR